MMADKMEVILVEHVKVMAQMSLASDVQIVEEVLVVSRLLELAEAAANMVNYAVESEVSLAVAS